MADSDAGAGDWRRTVDGNGGEAEEEDEEGEEAVEKAEQDQDR